MRQIISIKDEPHFLIRSLSVDYSAGTRVGNHHHSWPQLLYARAGAIWAEVEGAIWVVPPGRALWIPQGVRHRLAMLGATELRTLYWRSDVGPGAPGTQIMSVSGLLHEAILRTCELQFLDERIGGESRLAAVMRDELKVASFNSVRLPMPVDPRALQLANSFLNSASHQVSLDARYTRAGLSRRTAERIFKKETGVSPARWFRLARLSSGLEYLLGGGSIDGATEAAGYQSRSAFSEAFTKTFGFPPSASHKAH